jgi:phage portal protein BeeE
MGTGDLPVVGGAKGIASHQIGAINDDGLFIEWQKFLITVIAFSFGVDPKKLGMGSATDRSTVEEQTETTLQEAVKPMAKALAQAINDKVLRRLGYDNVLKFEFVFEETTAQKKAKADIAVLYYTNDGITQNEFRELIGYPPLTSKYSSMTVSEMKASINEDYAVVTGGNGGYNGVGKNRHAGD